MSSLPHPSLLRPDGAAHARLSRAVHDELGPLLSALKSELGWLEKRLIDQPALSGRCQTMRGLIDDATEHVERLMATTLCERSDASDLWTELVRHGQEFIDRSGLPAEWSVDIAQGLPAPQGPLAHAVLRIFQEMLRNVARHAQASMVTIRIRATHADLTVLVKDNGRGAPPSAFERVDAAGVQDMKERASRFGGWLQIDSQLGAGTQVILTMPLHPVGRLVRSA